MDWRSLTEGLLLIVLAGLGLYEGIRLLKVPLLFHDIIGPGWYVVFVSALLLVVSALYLRGQIKRRETTSENRFSVRLGPAGQVAAVFGLYVVIVPILGYAVGSACFFVLAFYVSGVKSWFRSIALGLAVGIIFELCFSRVARVPLP